MNGPLRIVYVGLLPPHPGGAPISCSRLLSGFARRGHVAHALSPIRASAFSGGDTFADQHPEIGVTRYVVPHDAINPGAAPVSEEYRKAERDDIALLLPRLIKDLRPDVILIGRESFLPYVIEVAHTSTVPSILMVRGGTTLALLRGAYSHDATRQFLARYAEVDHIIAVAEHFRARLAQMGIPEVEVIPNRVDLEEFQPKAPNPELKQRLKIPRQSLVMLFPAVLKSIKRPLDVAQSAEMALRMNTDLMYVIAGEGPLRNEMEGLCRERGLWERFRFVGWVDYSQMCDYMNLAQVVIMPSEGEGLARTYLETQACGRVLLASDIPASREVVEDGKTGLLFRTGDIKDLAAKTLLAASDPTLRDFIGRSARESMQSYSHDQVVDRYLTSIRRVIERSMR